MLVRASRDGLIVLSMRLRAHEPLHTAIQMIISLWWWWWWC